MLPTLAFILLFGWWQSATTQLPRVSATDTAYLSCTTWTGKNWTSNTARSAQTQVLESPKGYRAYAKVDVVVKSDGSCENTTMLFAATGAGRNFKVVYRRRPSGSNGDGSGIRLIGWSPDGAKLLAEVNVWRYEADTGYGHVPLVYDVSAGTAKEIDALFPVLENHFPTECEFELVTQGWQTNELLQVKVSRTPESDEYEQNFCVKKPLLLFFDLRTETLQAGKPAIQPEQ